MTHDEVLNDMAKKDEIIQRIREEYPDIDFPTPVLEPIYYGRLNKTVVENRKLILDKESGIQFDIVSDAYKLLHHELVMDDIIKSAPPEFGKPEINVSLFAAGARCFYKVTFPELDYDIHGSKGEVRFLLRNSYDRSSHLAYSMSAVEQICTNGLVGMNTKGKGRAKHINGSLEKFNMGERMKTGMEDLSATHGIWKIWMEKKLNEIEVLEVVEALPYSEKETEELMALPLMNNNNMSLRELIDKKKATLWTVNSAATQFVHELRSEERGIKIEHDLPNIINRFTA